MIGGGSSMEQPLGKTPVVAIGATRFYIGTADSTFIEVFALDGTPLAPIRWQGGSLATTDADIERYRLLDTLGDTQSLNGV